MNDLFSIYQDAYLAIRCKYSHPNEPILYGGWVYCEALPPRQWDSGTYSAYFDEVSRLCGWYLAARRYAAKRRKSEADQAAYLAACDQFGVAGHDLRFAGSPAPSLFSVTELKS